MAIWDNWVSTSNPSLNPGALLGDDNPMNIPSQIEKYLHKISANGPDNPADAASKYLDKIPGMLKDYYDPYINQGKTAYDQLSPEYSMMAKDPGGYLDSLMKGYKESDAFKFKRDEALKSAGNTAASGGMRGSLNDIQNSAHITDMLMNEDMQQWLQNVMGLKNTGLQGQRNFYDTGYDASKSLSGDISNVFGTKATNAFQGTANKNKMDADERNMITKLVTSLISVTPALFS